MNLSFVEDIYVVGEEMVVKTAIYQSQILGIRLYYATLAAILGQTNNSMLEQQATQVCPEFPQRNLKKTLL